MKFGYRLLAFALLAFLTPHALATTRYVNLNNLSPLSPYTNWPAAATNIQAAIDVSSPGDLILVTNGVYNNGSRTADDSTPCRVVINKAVTVQSVNGPGTTIVEGYAVPGSFPYSLNSVRCAYLTNNAALLGFTLSNGTVVATSYVNLSGLGGGVYCESSSAVVSNCVIINCAAYAGGGGNGGTFYHCLITNCIAHIGGGGVESGILDRCQVVWNTSDYYAGGLYLCQATNCTIIDNLGLFGGGAYGGSVCQCTIWGNYAPTTPDGGGYGGGLNDVDAKNSIIYDNAADAGGNDTVNSTLTNCCSSSVPSGAGNITNEPLFLDDADFPGNFHLQTNSPCINAGNNAFVSDPKDLDGRPRLVGPKVDLGAYELQSASTNNFLTWLWTYDLSTDSSSDFADPDGDGMNNWQEWIAGTNPTDALSVLKMITPAVTNNGSGVLVTWLSVTNRNYFLQASTNRTSPPVFSTIKSNIVGLAGTTSFVDTKATGSGPYTYRVGVHQ